MKNDIYQRVTDSILASLERGVRPWLKPWNAAHAAGRISRPLRSNLVPYQGINTLILWAEAAEKGFAASIWMTFKQALEFGGNVRKGEKGSPVVFASRLTRSETDAVSGEEIEREIPFLKGYTVFNVEQVDGLPANFHQLAQPRLETISRVARAETFFSMTSADIRSGGNKAFYTPHLDYVQMPPFEAFSDAESYYATLAHEVTHWTRHPKRLSREFGRERFGDEGYAMEELVAELGAAFLSADLDLTPTVRGDHASYIENRLKVLKNDRRAISPRRHTPSAPQTFSTGCNLRSAQTNSAKNLLPETSWKRPAGCLSAARKILRAIQFTSLSEGRLRSLPWHR